ncbi:MAG: hypothetical protein KF887_07740 [Paracoccaceae bacterium]|nr:MAG: hypothetical protein KF887_07740 [Paracoccaceae bacterium]
MALKGKGNKGKGGDEDDGESPFMPLEEVFRKLKSGTMNFGMYFTGDKDNPVLIAAHKRKNPEVLGKQAKKQAGTSKGAFGKVTLESGELRFECETDKVPGSMTKKLKVLLKNEGFMKFKPRILLPGGVELGESDDDGDDDDIDEIIAPGGSATKTRRPGSGGGEPDKEEKQELAVEVLTARADKLESTLAKLAEVVGDVADVLDDLIVRARDGIKTGDLEQASDHLDEVERRLKDAVGEKGADAGPDDDGGRRRGGGGSAGGDEGGGEGGGEGGKAGGAKPPKGGAAPEEEEGGKGNKGGKGDDKDDFDARWEEQQPILETLIETGDAALSGQAAKLLKMMETVLKSGDRKKAKGVLTVIDKFIENALEDLGDTNGDNGQAPGAGSGGGSGSGSGGSSGGANPGRGSAGGGSGGSSGGANPGSGSAGGGSGGSSGGANPGSGSAGGGSGGSSGGANPGAGGGSGTGADADEEARAKAAQAEALRVAQGASAASSGAEAARESAARSQAAAEQSMAEAETYHMEGLDQVGPERAAEVKAAFDKAKAAAEECKQALEEARAASAEAEAAAMEAQSTAQGTRDASGVQATQGKVQAAEAARAKADAAAAKARDAYVRAQTARGEAQELLAKALEEAKNHNKEKEAEAETVVQDIKAKVGQAAGQVAEGIIDTIVDQAKAAAKTMETMARIAVPGAGAIGDALISIFTDKKSQTQQMVETAIGAVTAAAQKIAEGGKALYEAEKAKYDAAQQAYEMVKKGWEAQEQAFEKIVAQGGSFVEKMLAAKRDMVKSGIEKVGEHNAKAGEALTETQSGVQALTGAISRAATGFIDRVSEGKVKSASGLLAAGVEAMTTAKSGVEAAITDFGQASTAAVQAAQAERDRLKQEAEDLAKPYLDKASQIAGVTGEVAVKALEEARKAGTGLGGMFGPIIDTALGFGGSLFEEAKQAAEAKKSEAEKAVGQIIAEVEKTKAQIETALTGKKQEIQTLAEQKKTEVTDLAERLKDLFGKPTAPETEFVGLPTEIGVFADAAKAPIDALKALRGEGTAATDAIGNIVSDIGEGIGRLGDLVKDAVEKIVPDLSDDPVTPKVEELDGKAKAAEAKAGELAAGEKSALDAILAAKKAAEDFVKGKIDEATALVSDAESIAKQAGTGMSGLRNGMISDLKKKLEELLKKQEEAKAKGGKIPAEVLEGTKEAQAKIEEAKTATEEQIKKAADLLKNEIDAWKKAHEAGTAQRDEIKKMVVDGTAEFDKVKAELVAKYGQTGATMADSARDPFDNAKAEVDSIATEFNAVRDAAKAAEAKLALVVDNPDNAAELIAAKDAQTRGMVTQENLMKRLPGIKTQIQAAIAKVRTLPAQAAADFKATEGRHVADMKSKVTTLQAQLGQAKLKKDPSALDSFIESARNRMGDANGIVTFYDDFKGGSEPARVRAVVAADRERIAQLLKEGEQAKAEMQAGEVPPAGGA